jgi:hypothetical protein
MGFGLRFHDHGSGLVSMMKHLPLGIVKSIFDEPPSTGASQLLYMDYAALTGLGFLWQFTTNRSRLRRGKDGANPPSNVPASPAGGGIFVENHRKSVKAP